jgi:hypothetical protein
MGRSLNVVSMVDELVLSVSETSLPLGNSVSSIILFSGERNPPNEQL